MQFFTCLVNKVFLVALLTVAAPSNAERECPDEKFGRHCRYNCHCQNRATCHDVTGRCDNGCAPGWSGQACQRRNVAFQMSATIRSARGSKRGRLAVDGNTETCISSKSNRTGWWKLDLLSSQTVYSMKIVSLENVTLRGWHIYVSDYDNLFWSSPCTTLRYSGSEAEFTCDTPVTGRFVGIMNMEKSVTLCEFDVYACENFTFGVEDCNSECACANDLEVCDHRFGTCTSGCKEGWKGSTCHQACSGSYGKNCVHRCGHCGKDQPCDKVTGVCPRGCTPGWSGPLCELECPAGMYGEDCSFQCDHCLDDAPCSPVNGICPGRCAPGWKGPRCDVACQPGRYGQNCNFMCGHCREESTCQRFTGVCEFGCKNGYEGLICNQKCLPGKYGHECRKICGKCITQPCDFITGNCNEDGCILGWNGRTCHKYCNSGFYGKNCTSRCGHCAGGAECDTFTGACPSGCEIGWDGINCLKVCTEGTWGLHCAHTCGLCKKNRPCNPVTGLCGKGCFRGYQGQYCTIKQEFKDLSSALLMPVMAVSVSIFLFVMISVIVGLIIKWRREYSLEELDQDKSKPEVL